MHRHLVVGLGNPEPRYAKNRHNVGFMAVERLADEAGITLSRSKFKGRYGTGTLGGVPVVVLEPLTYMNLSGRSVAPAAKFFDVPPERIIVAYDEIDLPYGRLRLKIGGGHAGHNGVRSMIAELGSRDFVRLRIGVGRPAHGTVSDFVLSDFRGEERDFLPDLLDRAAAALRAALDDGPRLAMNTVNST